MPYRVQTFNGLWHRVVWWKIISVSKEAAGSILRVKVTLKMELIFFSYGSNLPHFIESEISLPAHNRPPTAPVLSQSSQSMPSKLTQLRSIPTLTSPLRPGFPSGLFPSGFLTNTPHASLLSHTSHPTRQYSSNLCFLLTFKCYTLILPGQ